MRLQLNGDDGHDNSRGNVVEKALKNNFWVAFYGVLVLLLLLIHLVSINENIFEVVPM